jgi:DNA-binding TFAR19-related protein (PDSD5 family)
MRHGWAVFPILIFLVLGLCGFTRPARGSEPLDDRLGVRTAPIFLLTRPDIQADLKLDSRQIALCRRAALALQRQASLLRGRKDPGANAARLQVDDEMTRWLSKALTPDQLARLDQIDMQWEGAAAMLSRPFLAESLNLTPQQETNIRGCISNGRARRAQGPWTYEDHIDQTRKASATLDARQGRLWAHVLGDPCLFNIAAKAQAAGNEPAARTSANPALPRR